MSKSKLAILLLMVCAGAEAGAQYDMKNWKKDNKDWSSKHSAPESKKLESRIHLSGSKNIDFVITDPEGKRSGRNPLISKMYNESPRAVYERDLSVAAESTADSERYPAYFAPGKDGIYKFEIYGLATGEYRIEVGFSKGSESDDSVIEGAIEKGKVLIVQYELVKDATFRRIKIGSEAK